MAQRLDRLLGPDVSALGDIDGTMITGLTADSRAVVPGMVFAAMPGTRLDGARFLADALDQGAAALLVAADAQIPDGSAVPVLRAANPRLALAKVAARFYGPGPDTIVAVTGTSGKTSVAEFTRQIFAQLGHKAASLGTIGVIKPSGAVYGSLTTPDPITLARTLAELRAEGITHLAIEASSHGLDQHRLDGVRLTAGAFTNLGRDHMDYHPSAAHYLDAKLRLFRELLDPERGTAVVNVDGAQADAAVEAARERGLDLVTVGTQGQSIKLVSASRYGFRQRLEIAARGRTFDIVLPLIGGYQVENALTAAGLASLSEEIEPVLRALEHLTGVPGRLDVVGQVNGGLAVVDYAHKPEALAAALDAVRPFATGKLICVFGCGGDRDRGKRPIMGQIAVEKADVVIVTDDNPRSEDAAAIRTAILAGAPDAKDVGDRAQAIGLAIAMMGPGDVVLVAGKGHETGQIVGETVLPFSDHEVVAAALAEAHEP